MQLVMWLLKLQPRFGPCRHGSLDF